MIAKRKRALSKATGGDIAPLCGGSVPSAPTNEYSLINRAHGVSCFGGFEPKTYDSLVLYELISTKAKPIKIDLLRLRGGQR